MISTRRLVLGALAALAAGARAQHPDGHPQRRFQDAAEEMLREARAWKDQPYGAVIALGDAVVGEAPSRVLITGDPTRHAEREAIRDAQKKLGRADLSGAVMYSTSIPCFDCRKAAAEARIVRMYFGSAMSDGGAP